MCLECNITCTKLSLLKDEHGNAKLGLQHTLEV